MSLPVDDATVEVVDDQGRHIKSGIVILVPSSPWRFITEKNILLNYDRCVDRLETFYALPDIDIVPETQPETLP